MKPLKINQEDIVKAVQSGNPYIQVGNRKFFLLEVEEVSTGEYYEVTDSDEEKALFDALNSDNPLLSEAEINEMLGH